MSTVNEEIKKTLTHFNESVNELKDRVTKGQEDGKQVIADLKAELEKVSAENQKLADEQGKFTIDTEAKEAKLMATIDTLSKQVEEMEVNRGKSVEEASYDLKFLDGHLVQESPIVTSLKGLVASEQFAKMYKTEEGMTQNPYDLGTQIFKDIPYNQNISVGDRANQFVPRFQQPGVQEAARERFDVSQYIPVQTTDSELYEFNRENIAYALSTMTAGAAATSTNSVLVENVGGFYVGQAITIHYAATTQTGFIGNVTRSAISVDRTGYRGTITVVNDAGSDQNFSTAIVANVPIRITSNTILVDDIITSNPAGEGEADTEVQTVTVGLYRRGLTVPLQVYNNRPGFANWLLTRFSDFILEQIFRSVILRNPTERTSSSTAKFTSLAGGVAGTDFTQVDGGTSRDNLQQIEIAINRLLRMNVNPDTILMNTERYRNTIQLRTSGGDYFFGRAPSQILSEGSLLGLRVGESTWIANNRAYLGEFQRYNRILTRSLTPTVNFYPQHRDFAAKGLVYIQWEGTLAYYSSFPLNNVVLRFDM